MKKTIGWIIIATFIIAIIFMLVWNLGVLGALASLIIAISLSSLLILALDWVTGRDEDKVIIWKKTD